MEACRIHIKPNKVNSTMSVSLTIYIILMPMLSQLPTHLQFSLIHFLYTNTNDHNLALFSQSMVARHLWHTVIDQVHLFLMSVIHICSLQWSYGVTIWEIFSGGRNPYPAVDPMSLTQMLKEGKRLETPNNTTCSPEMYIIL